MCVCVCVCVCVSTHVSMSMCMRMRIKESDNTHGCAVRMYVCMCANDRGVCVCIHKLFPEKIPEFFAILVVSFRCAPKGRTKSVFLCVYVGLFQ